MIPEEKTLEELVTEFRNLKVKLAFELERLDYLQKKIKADIRETGEVPQVEGVQITFRKPLKPRVKWNTSALEGYAVANPDVLQFQTKYMPNPSIIIKVE